MSDLVYRIVEHDGGWAYKLGDVFSETFPTRGEAEAVAARVAAEQRVPGETEVIRYEDEKGTWHEETAAGDDRPNTSVEGILPDRAAAPSPDRPADLTLTTVLFAGVAGLLLAALLRRPRRR